MSDEQLNAFEESKKEIQPDKNEIVSNHVETKKPKKKNKKNKAKANGDVVETVENAENVEIKSETKTEDDKQPVKKSVPEKKVDTKSKNTKKGKNVSAFAKRLASAIQVVDQQKKEQEEREKELERQRQEERERELREEQRKAEKKRKEKEKKQRLKEEGKLLNKTQSKRKAKDKQSLQQLLQGGATCAALSNSNPSNTNNTETGPISPSSTESKEIQNDSTSSPEVVASSGSDNMETMGETLEEVKRPHIPDPVLRIKTRMEENRSQISTDKLRSPIISVMGHVDTGKTKILDKLRNTHVQDGEAGGITQQIGVTNVPLTAVKASVKMCKDMKDFNYKIGGLAIIDTPGHFSFNNLRSLGSSLCDMAILIVDIMHSVEDQTKESIKLLMNKKAPFVVALNKIDLIVDWKSYPDKSIVETLELQSERTKQHFEDLFKNTFVKFSELGLNLALFHKNTNPKRFISAIPTSARTGDGIGDLIAHICKFSQSSLQSRLAISKELEATVMEVRFIQGLGTTIDVILVNGTLKVGDRIIVPGLSGPICTHIRALLTPQPMKEMRVKGNYIHHNSISVSQGVKISAQNLEKVMAGLPIYVAQEEDEVEYYMNELTSLIDRTMASFDKKDKGVYVAASTLGSLEALLSFLSDSKIPYFGFNIGPVHKKDVTTAAIMHEHDPLYAVILAFDVKIDSDAKELADQLKVKIITANIIYHLFENFNVYEKSYKEQKAKEFKHLAVFPCILKMIPENVFKTRDPIIVGVTVEDGTARVGTPLCVPTRDSIIIGMIAGMEINHKPIEIAKKGQDVCIKIGPYNNDPVPKLLGRHFEVTDQLVSKITRESIDVMKEYFRDELSRQDWLLIKSLKTTFNIT